MNASERRKILSLWLDDALNPSGTSRNPWKRNHSIIASLLRISSVAHERDRGLAIKPNGSFVKRHLRSLASRNRRGKRRKQLRTFQWERENTEKTPTLILATKRRRKKKIKQKKRERS